MSTRRSVPKTYEDALKAGFKRFEDLPEDLRAKIRAHDKVIAHEFDAMADPCRPGFEGPCSTTDYPDGTRKVCYCSAANQCDDNCVFEQTH